MKRLVLCTALIAISLQGNLFAQEKETKKLSKTDRNFNMPEARVNNRHWVSLPKDEKMIIELHNTNDYKLLANMDSLLGIFMSDIAFYKDSLSATGNVRIDYSFTQKPGVRKLRFKKYSADGDIYISRQNDISQLKIEQDTVRIVFQQPVKDGIKTDAIKIGEDIPAQVTLVLNNYSDIALLLQDKGMFNRIIDTLNNAANPEHRSGFPFLNTTSIVYTPFDTTAHKGYTRFRKRNYLVDAEHEVWSTPGTLQINGSMGMSLVRNTLAPMLEMGIEVNDKWNLTPGKFSFVRLSATPYFFFERTSANHIAVYDNWFATLEFGTQRKNNRTSAGFGYLFAGKGGYFENTTMKLFVSFNVSKHFVISPELIFTNDLKQMFPGVTIRY